jgi:hypothetical protein
MKSLRLSMERVRLLTDQIKKREHVKKRHLLNMVAIFNLSLGIRPPKEEAQSVPEPRVAPIVTSEPVPVKPLTLVQADVKTRVSPVKKKVPKTPARDVAQPQHVIRAIENVISENSNSSHATGPVPVKPNSDAQTTEEMFDDEDKENSNQPPVEVKTVPVVPKSPSLASPLRKSSTVQSKLTFFFKT